MQATEFARVGEWLRECLGEASLAVKVAAPVVALSGCQVWDCEVAICGRAVSVVLKVYAAGFDDYCALGPADTARKHALALTEVLTLGVPTPRCLGWARAGEEAALVMEKVARQPWSSQTRAEAARVLAKLHLIGLADLSEELATLVSRSTPNRGRVGEVPGEPPVRERTLQHGDYFSVNIAATEEGICVLDWDLLAFGDSMWDLGFLVEADRGMGEREADEAIGAYEGLRAVDQSRLRWHRECWRAFWADRDQQAPAP